MSVPVAGMQFLGTLVLNLAPLYSQDPGCCKRKQQYFEGKLMSY